MTMYDNVKLGLMIDKPPVLDKPRLPKILVQYGRLIPQEWCTSQLDKPL